MFFSTLFNGYDYFIIYSSVCHILNPRKKSFLMPYQALLGFGSEVVLPLYKMYDIYSSTQL